MKLFALSLASTLLFTTLSFSISTPSYAANVADDDSAVSKNFTDIGRSLRKLRREKNPEKIVNLLTKIKDIANANMDLVPSFMTEGDKEFVIYQDEMKKMTNLIDELVIKVNNGDIKSGADVVKELTTLKKSSHKKVDLED
ncbi:cytochrome b562 [Thalassotalea crassostreae]|uniref:cytochrome b562 n=1 Tax=Thalassotalea crassostreae TaxID=1763536 RepID=UPI0008390F5C|nr:cytochrome b562 [Thalassotalea crassostreae]